MDENILLKVERWENFLVFLKNFLEKNIFIHNFNSHIKYKENNAITKLKKLFYTKKWCTHWFKAKKLYKE